MVYRGHIRNGKVELDESVELPEGGEGALSMILAVKNGKSLQVENQAEANSIVDKLDQIWEDAPEAEWSRLPADLTSNLDHYLYGTPKE